MHNKFNLGSNSKEYKEYVDLCRQLSTLSLEEINIRLDLYTLKSHVLNRRKNLFVKVPFFFTAALAIVTIIGNHYFDHSTSLFLLVFLSVISIFSIADVVTYEKNSSNLSYCELQIAVCQHLIKTLS